MFFTSIKSSPPANKAPLYFSIYIPKFPLIIGGNFYLFKDPFDILCDESLKTTMFAVPFQFLIRSLLCQ